MKSFNPTLQNTENCQALKRESSIGALIPDHIPTATSKKLRAKSNLVDSKPDSHPIEDNCFENARPRVYPGRIPNSRKSKKLNFAQAVSDRALLADTCRNFLEVSEKLP